MLQNNVVKTNVQRKDDIIVIKECVWFDFCTILFKRFNYMNVDRTAVYTEIFVLVNESTAQKQSFKLVSVFHTTGAGSIAKQTKKMLHGVSPSNFCVC